MIRKKSPDDHTPPYRREAELVHAVRQAIAQLQREGKRVTYDTIADLVGLSADGLIYYPQIRAILRANKPEPRRYHGEALLLAQVQQAVARLEGANARLSRAAVARQVGLSGCGLKYYPRINAFVAERVARYQQQQAEKQRQREMELVSQAQQAMTLLAVSGNCLTQTAIREMIGLSLSQVQQYPRLKALLQEATQAGGSARHL